MVNDVCLSVRTVVYRMYDKKISCAGGVNLLIIQSAPETHDGF